MLEKLLKLARPLLGVLRCFRKLIMVRKRHLQHHQHSLNDSDSRPKRKHHHTKQRSVPWFLYITLAFLTAVVVGYVTYQWYLRSRVNTPLNSPKVTTSIREDDSMLWGSYRPGVYFGLKTRKPDSLIAGLMWFQQDQPQHLFSIRHWCNQNDRLAKYGWKAHDGRTFGIHEVTDGDVQLQQSFIKSGKHWTAEISVSPLSKTASQNASSISLLFYFALNGTGKMQSEVIKKRLNTIQGHTPDLGEFTVQFGSSDATSGAGAMYHYLASDQAHLDSLHDVVMRNLGVITLKSSGRHVIAVMNRVRASEERFLVHQITARPPFTITVQYTSNKHTDASSEHIQEHNYQSTLDKNVQSFDTKFEEKFQLQAKGFSSGDIQCAKAALSNMIGGIGYFYGSSIVQSKYTAEPMMYWAAPLYTGVPSRSFFPRGFLWDEGFHNLLISQWDWEISKDILAHWFDLINTEGWIPREQILDDEARSRVPAEFVVQHNRNANPPTLFLPLQHLMAGLVASESKYDELFVKNLFPRLKAWYSWFNTTQLGALPGAYRWHGRDAKTNRELNPKTLTSGLDDYPRASHPTDEERHVDLRCWMALASRVLARFARMLNESDEPYESTYKYLSNNRLLDALHWSEDTRSYSDYGLHSTKVKLERPQPPKNMHQQPRREEHVEMVRVVNESPTYRFVDAYGYVSLFPFLLHILEPDSDKLGRILDDLSNPQLLWTDYGLRSLARTSALYKKSNTEHDPPYWRGQIWINMNYLAVRALHHYREESGKYQEKAGELYAKLRLNLVRNIISNYDRTGYIWEQYDDVSGEGRGSHPFTGWSALFLLMMAETY